MNAIDFRSKRFVVTFGHLADDIDVQRVLDLIRFSNGVVAVQVESPESATNKSRSDPAMTARDIAEAIDELIRLRICACSFLGDNECAELKLKIAKGLAEHSVYGTIFAEPKK